MNPLARFSYLAISPMTTRLLRCFHRGSTKLHLNVRSKRSLRGKMHHWTTQWLRGDSQWLDMKTWSSDLVHETLDLVTMPATNSSRIMSTASSMFYTVSSNKCLKMSKKGETASSRKTRLVSGKASFKGRGRSSHLPRGQCWRLVDKALICRLSNKCPMRDLMRQSTLMTKAG